eukprot:6579259-Pyramimonas_sp.AAC.1
MIQSHLDATAVRNKFVELELLAEVQGRVGECMAANSNILEDTGVSKAVAPMSIICTRALGST